MTDVYNAPVEKHYSKIKEERRKKYDIKKKIEFVREGMGKWKRDERERNLKWSLEYSKMNVT